MKKCVFVIFLSLSQLCHASCELEEYTKYLNHQNEAFLEAASLMSTKDESTYNLVKEFIVLHIRANKLKIYTAKRLEASGSELINKSGNVANFIKSTQRVMADGKIISIEEETLKNDTFYVSEKKALGYFNDFYLFGFNLEGAKREEWNRFSNAREVFNNYLRNTKNQSLVSAAFNKKYSDVCKL